ncbi:hypothetical protein CC2G_008489 [Coprinopsis cinerea AmutBmut pab1-1]|nr:hypothetical protein CC2G_008489 [Coprinopsis cinerea AmutBmut pab1-1]
MLTLHRVEAIPCFSIDASGKGREHVAPNKLVYKERLRRTTQPQRRCNDVPDMSSRWVVGVTVLKVPRVERDPWTDNGELKVKSRFDDQLAKGSPKASNRDLAYPRHCIWPPTGPSDRRLR